MGVVLEIRAGVAAGRVIGLTKGRSVTVGRATGRAEFALPEDTFMSGVHFAVECGPSGCRVVDRKSSNGTFLNGAKIQDAMLANGDEIKAGKTVFQVKIVADEKIAAMNLPQSAETPAASRPSCAAEPVAPQSPREAEPAARPQGPEPPARIAGAGAAERIHGRLPPGPTAEPSGPPVAKPSPRADERALDANAGAREGVPGAIPQRPIDRSGSRRAVGGRTFAFTVMGWSFPAAPANWQVQEGFGLQRAGESEFPSSVAATEEALAGITLQQFVESQISMLRGYLRDPKIEPTMPPQVDGADEVMGMDVRHATKDGTELAYRHIYARSNSSVGILTVTTLAAEFPKVIESLQPILDGAAFRGRSE